MQTPQCRRVFYSFHYREDAWRTQQIRHIGAVDGSKPASPNDWEEVKIGGRVAIQRWIDNQMMGRSCTVVLVGSNTAGRYWINYEIKKSWEKGMGIVGLYIHGLKDNTGQITPKGGNPFVYIECKSTLAFGERNLSSVVKCYSPTGRTSQDKYQWIEDNLKNIIEKAIIIRQNNSNIELF